MELELMGKTVNLPQKNEDHFSKKHVLRAALYLLPPANDDERQESFIDDRLQKLLLLAQDSNSITTSDIEDTLNLNADNRKHHENIINCIIKILQNGVLDECREEIPTDYGNLNLRAKLYLLFRPNDPDIDDRLRKLLLLARNSNSITIPDIEDTLNLNASNRMYHEEIIKCIIKLLQNGVHNESIKQLLKMAVVNDNLNVTVMLLKPKLKTYENGLNEITVEDAKTYLPKLLEKCCSRGHDSILKYLLSIIPKTEKDFINENPLLCCVLKEMIPSKPGFQRCLSLLLEDDRVMIDRAEESRRTPLYYAAAQRNEDAQKTLLAKGANLGTIDVFGIMLIDYIDPILLDKHLNTCVTSNDLYLLANDYKLIIDFKNFIPTQISNSSTNPHNQETPHSEEDGQSLINDTNVKKEMEKELPEIELSTILKLAQKSANHSVLQHPVISCILAIKRKNLFLFRWMYCLYYLIHYILLMVVWICCNDAADNCVENKLLLLNIYLVVRFILVLVMDVVELCNVILILPSVLLWRIIQLSPICLFNDCLSKDSQLYLTAILLLVLAIEATRVLLNFNVFSIATNLIMFMRVLKNFCLGLFPFVFIIGGCVLSFNILFGHTSTSGSASQNESIGNTSRRVFIMMAGELNTEKLDLQSPFTYLIFLMFVIVIVIVWNNFMNSLAVDDTLGLRAKSQFLAIKQEVIFMHRIENILKTLKSILR
ncbi:transient receptor potential cation channel protein painless-like [Anopheles aquasalis]|uniref:transient receptor potential cation channel protein painless-like n=1 Tax=Anopheles aquasalis TaxID=42839 RepID=UPI00215B461A|nr:transient receptor potential cation channel protein painless-like [Anopheles aquasalis]